MWEKYNDLPDFPRIIDLEVTSSCNFRCLMCPTGNFSLKRPAEFMDTQTFSKIVMQCMFHGTALRFIGWGEPTLHPQLVNFISTANRNGLITHLNTNGSKITDEYAAKLCEAGLTSVKFSFQGVDKRSYEQMRRTDFFDGMIQAIKIMRGQRKGGVPFISASTTTTWESQYEIRGFRRMMEPLVDQLTIGRTIFDFMDLNAVRLRPGEKAALERLKDLESVEKRHPNPCPEVFNKLSIHCDGSVRVCCNDYNGETFLGNVNDTTIKEMWRHPEMEAYRKRLADKNYDAPLCKDCFDYHDLTKGVEDVPEAVER